MPQEVNYKDVRVKEPEKTSVLLTSCFGFSFCDTCTAVRGTLIGNKFGNNYLLLPAPDNLPANVTLTINTDDCLKDYHLLTASGIKFESKPRYTSNGLEATIADQFGNRYNLLEKRDYSEA